MSEFDIADPGTPWVTLLAMGCVGILLCLFIWGGGGIAKRNQALLDEEEARERTQEETLTHLKAENEVLRKKILEMEKKTLNESLPLAMCVVSPGYCVLMDHFTEPQRLP